MANDLAINYDADSDITAPAPTAWNTAYTVNFWAYHTDVTTRTQAVLFVYDDTSGWYDALGIDITTGYMWIFSESPAGSDIDRLLTITPVNTWRYYSLVRQSATLLELYVNNALILSHTLDMTGASSGSATLYMSDHTAGNSFLGYMAYSRMWSDPLTGAESAAEQYATSALTAANLWGDWPLQGATDLSDISGNARNFTLSGGLTTVAGPGIATMGLNPMSGIWGHR